MQVYADELIEFLNEVANAPKVSKSLAKLALKFAERTNPDDWTVQLSFDQVKLLDKMAKATRLDPVRLAPEAPPNQDRSMAKRDEAQRESLVRLAEQAIGDPRVTGWEERFLVDVRRQLRNGYFLSRRQFDKLMEILRETKGRPLPEETSEYPEPDWDRMMEGGSSLNPGGARRLRPGQDLRLGAQAQGRAVAARLRLLQLDVFAQGKVPSRLGAFVAGAHDQPDGEAAGSRPAAWRASCLSPGALRTTSGPERGCSAASLLSSSASSSTASLDVQSQCATTPWA